MTLQELKDAIRDMDQQEQAFMIKILIKRYNRENPHAEAKDLEDLISN